MKNPILGRAYTEEVGDYRGVSRVLVKKFRIYYQQIHNDIVIVAILFPGSKALATFSIPVKLVL
ncbi:MAG: hypothetical protein KGZ63_06315 [Clostridiales bacterium]|nr:hypothetical protein [Clostridiales bacterium]